MDCTGDLPICICLGFVECNLGDRFGVEAAGAAFGVCLALVSAFSLTIVDLDCWRVSDFSRRRIVAEEEAGNEVIFGTAFGVFGTASP